jgi:hypothetical protein
LLVDRLLTTAHTSHLTVLDELVDLVLNFTHNRKYAVKLFILVLAKARNDLKLILILGLSNWF